MAKKPVKKAFSNNSTVKKKPKSPKKSGPCGKISNRGSRGPRKLKP